MCASLFQLYLIVQELIGMQDLKRLWLNYYMITTTTVIGVRTRGPQKHGTESSNWSMRSSPMSNLQRFKFKTERELKREYRVLKEARQQSGASWDDKLCRIVADQPVWDKILSVRFLVSCC